ncbi:diguanylate cyclase (GGDEF) domain-containing protein [Aureimonas phyllosphaerae]|uniref:putative bifunctional diguanylate cyclase/phosphodiesterase n=1 Tax=Aureimonas phyllosphaerae TaxID=1166078 RepID=UPI0008E93079|nr:bifunctional diguanylate cyclase/phosphodiesterase [Aureimonas phyllosphaerae]SFF24626.1 diguanylate cyclase (GGDEF) domain-containing protein [Aureimonas phyllosphaerae]
MIHQGKLTLPRSFHRLRFGLIAVTALLAVTAVAVSLLAAAYQHRIDEASRYNRTFDAAQTLSELLRLQLAFARADSADDLDELELRAAILKNRATLLDSVTFPIAEMRSEFIPRLAEAIREIEPLLDRMPGSDATEHALATLDPLVQPLARMTSRSHAMAGDEVARTQTHLRFVFASLCAVTLMLVLFGAALVIFVLRQNRRLDRTVRTDALTGLANRLEFGLRLDRLAADRGCAVVLIDVDHFKTLNDTYGHDVGDAVLGHVSRRLTGAARDAALLARIGGDEFAVLYEGEDAQRRSRAACERILDRMRHPIAMQGRDVPVGVTLGLRASGAGEPVQAPDALLKDADLALYAAKVAGRGRATEFQPEMKQAFLDRHRLQNDLRGAVERGEHRLQFQPIVDLQADRTLGFEALVRWDHPELGPVPPSRFIPLAEESGLILDLGRWVLREAISTARLWSEDVFIAVNISARQLTDADLVPFISATLADLGVPPRRLEIEITETALVDNDAIAIRTLRALRDLGCRIALDDFGTGYASLSYLQRFHFDKLKIDRSFVESCRVDENSSAIIAAVCALARRLRLSVVAEGIETADHRVFVAEVGCGLGQGYLFDRPLTQGEALERLAREANLTQAPTSANTSAIPATVFC